jgi:condensin complex subunit 3
MAFSMSRLVNLDYTASAAAVPIDPQQVAMRKANILAVMTSLLDSEDPELYTTAAEGICKLYMTGHIVSAKLLSKLIIMYYSPNTEDEAKLRACLSCFLPQFSFLRPCNQVCMEETFMLILKALINAPPDSYLSKIDLTKVMEVMFNLTNPKNLRQQRNNQRVIQNNNICHENIVRSICYEVLNDDNAYKCKTYLKVKDRS